jgi:hypothetical protein
MQHTPMPDAGFESDIPVLVLCTLDRAATVVFDDDFNRVTTRMAHKVNGKWSV